MLIMTPDEIRNAENKANNAGLSYETMMENAGKGCADYITSHHRNIRYAVILCGKGKNGGDGFVIARYFAQKGINTSIILVSDSPSDDLSEKNKNRLPLSVKVVKYSENIIATGALLADADVIVDAVFGIGFRGTLPKNTSDIFKVVKISKAIKIAIDIPSGLSVDGSDFNNCFVADETLSMLCYKREHIYKPWRDYCGKVSVIPIGFKVKSDKLLSALPACEVKDMLVDRPSDSNKGTFGKVLITAGCYRMPGAAVIAAKGAASSGTGLTCLAFPDSCYAAIAPQIRECVLFPLLSDKEGAFASDNAKLFEESCNKYDAAAIGCGTGIGYGTEKILTALLKHYTKTLIIDADGINIISHNKDLLKNTQADIILTPHPGEMSRLTGLSIDDIKKNRITVAKEYAKKLNTVILLKGSATVIAAPDERCLINPTGSSALARGGSGDLLTGIITSFAAQGMKAFEAAAAGAYVHGLAGEIAGTKYTEYASSNERILSELPTAFSMILNCD